MNLSRAISQLKRQYGLYEITLPFKDDITGDPIPTETIIRDVLVNTTIPTYSQFVPWIREGTCHLKSLKRIDKNSNIYMLPAWLTITPVMYVLDVSLPMINNRGTFGDVAPAYGINRSVQGVLTSQAYMMVAGQMRAEPTFDYKGANQIQLYGYPQCDLTFVVACEHEPNGETIEDGCYASFMELAALDLKIFLYNSLKMYDSIPTAFGEIKLKIESYEGAEEARNGLLDKWTDTFHLDMGLEHFM